MHDAPRCPAQCFRHEHLPSLPDRYSPRRVYREARREAGLDPQTGRVALMLHTYVHEDGDLVRERVRGPFREYLRTSFDLASFSEPLQLVHSEPVSPFEVEDLRHLTPAAQDEALASYSTPPSGDKAWLDVPDSLGVRV